MSKKLFTPYSQILFTDLTYFINVKLLLPRDKEYKHNFCPL